MEHAGWEARQRRDMPRLEESTIQAEDVFANPGPAAVNSLGRAGKTLLQASLEEKEHRDGGKPLPVHPHADTGDKCHIPSTVFRWKEGNEEKNPQNNLPRTN